MVLGARHRLAVDPILSDQLRGLFLLDQLQRLGDLRLAPTLEILSVADLGLGDETGASGARQEITDVVAAESRSAGEKYVDEGDGAERIVGFLESIKVL